ncbi:hypothetical protein FEM48_Zijuj01G0094700 [Ziziphus jujuba var. spinosa]|uniref:Retrotransposon gag domain-containing protein n=1 Tax=Ziziphus jujuba var. spinosa TaxID=714518 RepID=A0A978W0G1_ZIZJJ|nr:hypothetical protein FEM48_Zijuj01G0094700 [Ziziphus jujuba var. spinosa]
METRGKTNAEFRNEVNEMLARHESNFDQVHSTLQQLMTEVQHLRLQNSHMSGGTQDVNPFAPAEPTQPLPPPRTNSSGTDQTPHLSFPRFNGEEPSAWLYRTEQYFEFKNIPTDQHVQLASFHLDGIALQWYRWLTKIQGPSTWLEFSKSLLHRFGPTDYEDPSEALTRLKQTTTVEAYQESFEKLSHQVDGLPERFLIGCFVAGLKDEVRIDVKIKHPRSLAEAIGVARLIEERNYLHRRTTTNLRAIPTAVTPKVNINPTPRLLGPPLVTRNNSIRPGPAARRVSAQEARERREKGLCYYCDEKFAPGHRCMKPQLFMIEDSLETEEEENVPQEDDQDVIPEIYFHAISGTDHPQTLRVTGRIKSRDLMVLIDGGSLHNFIDQSVVQKLGIPIDHTKKFSVIVANKECIECVGVCRSLQVRIQGYTLFADYYVLPVATCPLVLGVQWLETLGPVKVDYKHLTMSFKQGEKEYTFQGIKQQGLEALNDKEIQKLKGLCGTGF